MSAIAILIYRESPLSAVSNTFEAFCVGRGFVVAVISLLNVLTFVGSAAGKVVLHANRWLQGSRSKAWQAMLTKKLLIHFHANHSMQMND